MKILIVAGARPNFMKIGPLMDEINKFPQLQCILVHTGQHYDNNMSKIFFDELGIPRPDINLDVGSGSHAEQTAEIMKRFEKVCLNQEPTHVLVVGDVNSTIACSLVAVKMGIKVIHVEAGLRSFDRSMPEEINRVLTDAISDYLFITEKSAEENLLKEGHSKDKIYFVGNVMIDTLLKHKERAGCSDILDRLGLLNSECGNKLNEKKEGNCDNFLEKQIQYAVLTLHRPSNVDDQETFKEILEALLEISKSFPIIFPSHPRTVNRIQEYKFQNYFHFITSDQKVAVNNTRINCIEPLSYLDFLNLVSKSRLVLTDSGGIQEETTILGIPCITIRNNTERPITVAAGTNSVVGNKKASILTGFHNAMSDEFQEAAFPPLWDGKAAQRIVEILLKEYEKTRNDNKN